MSKKGLSIYSDEFYMRQAIAEAGKAATADEVPVGAVVVCNQRIIARAHNLTEQLTDVTAHAEMQAITAAANYLGAKYLEEATLYVTLEPCPMCAGALYWARIGKVVWGAPDPKRGFTLTNPQMLHPSTAAEHGLLEDECSRILTEYFQKKRNH
ncbi:MAG: nucleoside deaminase [Bacteroidales bacterium]